MKITKEKNKIYFDFEDKSSANINIKNDFIKIELIKTELKYRGQRFASKILKYIIGYIKINFKSIKKILLSPLPLDINGLDLNELISFYKRYNFKKSDMPSREEPHLMVRYI